nr:hypothetical protein CFP56_09562 [Quercus suber]
MCREDPFNPRSKHNELSGTKEVRMKHHSKPFDDLECYIGQSTDRVDIVGSGDDCTCEETSTTSLPAHGTTPMYTSTDTSPPYHPTTTYVVTCTDETTIINSNGQVRAPQASQISDGQVQAPQACQGSDGHVQASTSPSSAPPSGAPSTGLTSGASSVPEDAAEAAFVRLGWAVVLFL